MPSSYGSAGEGRGDQDRPKIASRPATMNICVRNFDFAKNIEKPKGNQRILLPQQVPNRPKMAPRWPKIDPRWRRDQPRPCQDHAKTTPWECSWQHPCGPERAPCCMGSIVLKKRSAMLHGSAPGRPPAPPDHPKTTPRPLIEPVTCFHQQYSFFVGKM